MFFYISFLRPPPLTASTGTVLITPQIANDLRTELFEGEQDIFYSWVLVTTGEATKGTKLTTWRGQSSAYKEIPVPLPRSARQGSVWRLVLGNERIRLPEDMDGAPFGVMSMPIVVGRGAGTANSDQIERVYTFGEDKRVRITEQTSFDLDKKIWDSGIGLSAWLVENVPTSKEPLEVLELGTGTGMVSLVWGALRPEDRILATDVESAMPLLERNIAANASHVEAAVLNWNEKLPDTVVGRVFDVLVMADVSYNTASFPALVKTIQGLKWKQVMVGYKERDEGERELWQMLETIGIKLKLIGRQTGRGGMPVEIWIH